MHDYGKHEIPSSQNKPREIAEHTWSVALSEDLIEREFDRLPAVVVVEHLVMGERRGVMDDGVDPLLFVLIIWAGDEVSCLA